MLFRNRDLIFYHDVDESSVQSRLVDERAKNTLSFYPTLKSTFAL